MTANAPANLRNLVLVLGDQLDPRSRALSGFEPASDLIWMAEVPEEAQRVWSHKARIALFLSAMRHFAAERKAEGLPLRYHRTGGHRHSSLSEALAEDLAELRPQAVVLVRPGEWGLRETLQATVEAAGVDWAERDDDHFLVHPDEFADFARGRREIRMEHFYRWLRKRDGILIEDGKPAGGEWNFDASNRGSFGRKGPGMLPPPLAFAPDSISREVIADVELHYPEHPGSLEHFDWPVTPAQATAALDDFVEFRLPAFGRYQDAMWSGEPWLFHARLSAAMNLKLIDPRVVANAAIEAWRAGRAPIEAVEGFVRQIIGWREYVRGLYWLRMPGWLQENALGAEQPLPGFYWTGDTDMNCLRESIGQTLRHGYAHHIQRLMVTGLFAQLLGVRPAEVHAWYLAIYIDAVEWVELPNVLGMSQFADGGVMASKPYCASGRYIDRMSDYCQGCRFDPGKSTGDDACPFTTLYWDFLDRHRDRFASHPRAALQWRSVERLDEAELQRIREQAQRVRERVS